MKKQDVLILILTILAVLMLLTGYYRIYEKFILVELSEARSRNT